MISYLDRITVIPDLCNGKPTIRGKRLTVQTLLAHLASGESYEILLEAFPFLERQDIVAALQYASLLADHVSIPLPDKNVA